MGRPKKPVIMDGKKRFDSLTDAAKWLIENGRREGKIKNMVPNISTCCHGKAEMVYGHTWKFEEE